MSGASKRVYLQERIKHAKNERRYGYIFGIAGTALAVFYFLVSQDWIWTAVGISLVAVGFALVFYYGKEYEKLMKELKQMPTSTPKCPRCGKEPPEGKFSFCPFCGAQLQSGRILKKK